MDSKNPQLPVSTNTIGPRTILRVILAYAIFGFAWVCSSDLVVYFRGPEPLPIAALSLAKGLLFVASSGIVLYLLLTRCLRDTVVERDTFREKLRNWSLNANDIVLVLDTHGRILEANDRAIAAYGYSVTELVKKDIADLLTTSTGLQERWKSLFETGTLRAEVMHRRADGSHFPVEFSARLFDLGASTFIHTVIRDITARRDTEKQLTAIKNTYAALFQTNQCINMCSNREEMFQQACEIAIRHTGLKLAWIGLVDWARETIVPVAKAGPAVRYVDGLQLSVNADSAWSKGVAGRAVLGGRPVVANDLWKSHGFEAWIERLTTHGIQSWAAYPLFQSGQTAGVLTLYSDDPQFFTAELAELLGEMADDLSLALDRLALSSKQKELEAELQRLKKAVEQSPVTVVISDPTGAIQYVNPAFTVSSGYSAEEALGNNPRILKSGETPPEDYAAMWQCLKDGEAWAGMFHNKRKDGTLYWEEAVISPVKDSQGDITHFIAVKQDVTARREAEARARFLAFHDPLTKLPNRLVARDEMVEAIKRADDNGVKAALLFIDVDNFKRINDSLGHTTGDHLLQALVQRLTQCMREEDTLSRVSGDEFLVVAPGMHRPAAVEAVADRIRKALSRPLEVDGMEISTTVSIGAAMYPDDGVSFEELHRQADLAMYCAKREGRDTFRIYNKSMETDSRGYVLTVNGLRKALENGEFLLHYQPQVHVKSGEVTAVEALVRWNHPEVGIVQPGKFIHIAEDSGLIIDIGHWIIKEACRQGAEWRRSGLSTLRVATNVSAIQMRRGGLETLISSALAASRFDPEALEIELTESALIHDNADVAELLRRLKNLGVGIALDDFGTGYSNFTYLKHFDLDRLKIDQSFVRNITSNRGDMAIVRSIVQLARNFGFETVAEGVETDEALKIVRRAGCDHVQGYLLARPMPASEIPAFVSSRTSLLKRPEFGPPECRYYPPNIAQ
jgi:diguanylate cyclase (GGDEF)-like protein/PAS domain S-box-containing protein